MGRARISLLLVCLVVGLAGLAAAPESCLACSCAQPKPPAEARDSATAVFQGRVVAIAEGSGAQNLPQRRITMRAMTSWRGDVPAEVAIYTAQGSAACGYSFEVGSEYLVYAYTGTGGVGGTTDALNTNLCNRTRLIADAAADLAVLGPGQPIDTDPTAGPSGNFSPQTTNFGVTLAPLLAGLLSVGIVGLVMAFIGLRVRRRGAARPR